MNVRFRFVIRAVEPVVILLALRKSRVQISVRRHTTLTGDFLWSFSVPLSKSTVPKVGHGRFPSHPSQFSIH
jgi:hypothetical protein